MSWFRVASNLETRNESMTNLIDEIKEDLKREQLLKIWQTYHSAILGTLAVLIVGGAGYLYWDHRQDRLRLEATQAYEAAVTLPTEAEQEKAFQSLSQGPKGYALLGAFEAAELAKDPASAYRAIAKENRHDKVFRDLATLKALLKDLPSKDPQALLEEVATLTKTATPWRESAYEIEAIVTLKMGQLEKALSLFERLAHSKKAPRGVRQRSQAMLDLVRNP